MNIIESFRIALSAIWSNKMRSILTMLGLIIGISSVVTIVSLGNGTQDMMVENFESLGINKITIYTSKGVKLAPKEILTIDDVNLLKEKFPDVIEAVVPNVSRSASIEENLEDKAITVKGTSTDSEKVLNIELLSGRFINTFDINSKKNWIVIPSDLSTSLYGTMDAIGESIMISSGRIKKNFHVIGVYESTQTLGGFSNPIVYMPYSTYEITFNTRGLIQNLELSFFESADKATSTSRIINLLERVHGNVGEEKYASYSPEENMEMVSESLSMITLFISSIAAISLIVGGIGIMNIMLVSVTERTREIGIRKSLGARRQDILAQFLIEAVTVSLLGGLLGSILGWVLTKIVSNLINTPATLSIDSLVIAIVFSASIGIFFGIYPANKAAKLDPIVALRYE